MKKNCGRALVFCCLVGLAGCGESAKSDGKFATIQSEELMKPFQSSNPNLKTLPSGLKYVDEKEGTGAEAEAGKAIYVHYSGYLPDGTMFDSSVKKGQVFPLTLGAGRVIKGWEEGIAGMKEGGKRKLLIPPALGYGSRGFGGSIPPNSDLVFDIELIKVQ